MKFQLITLLLIGSLFSLTACGGQNTEQSPSSEQQAPETTTEESGMSGEESTEKSDMSGEESTEDSSDE